MDKVVIKFLDQEQFYLLEEFCESEGIVLPKADFAKVAAAIDLETQKVVGVSVAQMQIHTEPMWIKKEYQGDGLWQKLADTMEGYLGSLAYETGENISVWAQPTNAAAERICRMRGYSKSDKPLWTKTYTGEGFVSDVIQSVIEEEDIWQPQSPPQ